MLSADQAENNLVKSLANSISVTTSVTELQPRLQLSSDMMRRPRLD
jgi:hypothetical protein